MRHTLSVVLALTACAVLAGARSLLAVGEWIADVPPQVLTTVGARPDPLLPQRRLPAETTVRRLLAGSTATPSVMPSGASAMHTHAHLDRRV
ncbi:transposase family protein [Streptomyces sp. NPDC050287]|uniref:transposase family protein n=1 Tax=Streptomyces sp. NPDC050287 TaxID=3365608 RepID=UPI0037A84A0F